MPMLKLSAALIVRLSSSTHLHLHQQQQQAYDGILAARTLLHTSMSVRGVKRSRGKTRKSSQKNEQATFTIAARLVSRRYCKELRGKDDVQQILVPN
jgi:hypothetical protein